MKRSIQATPNIGFLETQDSKDLNGPGSMNQSSSSRMPLPSTSQYIAVIDDEDIFREQWVNSFPGYQTICFQSGEDFLREWENLPMTLIAVLTDKYLGSGIDGISLAKQVRQRAPELPIFLSTSDLSVKDDGQLFDLIIDKDAIEESPKILNHLRSRAAKPINLPGRMREALAEFEAQAKTLKMLISDNDVKDGDFGDLIYQHTMIWKELLADLPESQIQDAQLSMQRLDSNRLLHDIKASCTRIKILLRSLGEGDTNLKEISSHLYSRFEAISRNPKPHLGSQTIQVET